MKSTEFLQAAIDVQAERGVTYDKPTGERSMGATVTAFNAITGRDMSEAEGWLLLQTLKDVRQWQNPSKYHHDSALDGVAYSALKAEALSEEQVLDPSHAISDLPDGYHWDDAPEDFEWMATDREGAFWFRHEPEVGIAGKTWAWQTAGCKTIDTDEKKMEKYQRPTSTAQ
jgi:hypothetical protein